MRLSTVILPIHRWSEGQKIWQRAEDLGFHAAYTYDHLSWRSFRDEPWFGSVPTLTAAACATERIRLGTLVTSPNFRHPVTLAKELITLDDVSGGRVTLGIGAGGTGFDATAMGQEAWSPRERADRFAEFLPLLDELLTTDATTREGTHYSAVEARNIPGCVQTPRLPFYVAATGPRGLKLAAEHGQGWVTYGDPRGPADVPVEQAPEVIAAQLAKLTTACEAVGRDVAGLEKVLLQGSTAEKPLQSLDAFVDWAGRYQEIGITELVIHWPVPDSIFANDLAVFEQIATEGLAQLA
ncbi:Luciferase-like monooxygenase [Kitasatospora sp. MMS16-BH015]|uniref:LLM class flavin-dependent oxidoreductase n=1 Tax=Kitasatospora sp. MMS16-BH015 TaxID=2018025 RepID=UPI000CA0B764|nr:LLM class flavin-dependent oxidoreductase [Kitasatospora sp. MMS16-BH015]AUG78701.1 Luciferase-like monooxygenase [Kitasatospora sp. MMS16-BH015]